MTKSSVLFATGAAFIFSSAVHAATSLKLEVYNPGERSIFPVSSEIISGPHEAVLIDAQFQRNDAQELVKKIKETGRKLTTVYISHSDPDYYFGLDTIKAAFPDAKIIATPQTVAAIQATQAGKLAYWGPILQENAPKKVIIPEVLHGDSFSVDGEKLQINGLKGATPDRTFVWVPALNAVVGGVVVSGNMHLWMADSQSVESRKNWLTTLDNIAALQPKTVVPGHFLPGAPQTLESVTFTQNYLITAEQELPKAKDSAQLIAAMKKHYPQLSAESDLEMSAKVLKGEMQWPQ
jgi:glyoxylase-like metal-dependent hydrolase (beta-lactamase superfamily II)